MQFRIRTLLLIFVILWSAMAAFEGGFGVFITVVVVVFSAMIQISQKRLTKWEWATIAIIIVILLGLLLPGVQSSAPTPEGSRLRCRYRLKQLSQALLAYHDKHGSFPPAYSTDKAGTSLLSWRVQTLPFIDGNGFVLFKSLDLSQPWNATVNSRVTIPSFSSNHGFWCRADPSRKDTKTPNEVASYLAVVGPQTAWRGSVPVKISDLPDAGRRMILLIESADRGINWKEPKDLSYEEAVAGINSPTEPSISSKHFIGGDFFHPPRRGAYVAFVDGSVHFLPEDIPPEDLKAMLTGDTTQPIDLDALEKPSLIWSRIVALLIFIPTSTLLVIGTYPQQPRHRPEQNAAYMAVQPDSNEPQ